MLTKHFLLTTLNIFNPHNKTQRKNTMTISVFQIEKLKHKDWSNVAKVI
jgi:hypothetical protein